MDVSEILTIISKIVSVFLLALGLIAFVFKNYISAFIKTRFSIQLEKENTKYRQGFLKELEEYKSNLVRDLESHKLEIDIRKGQTLIYIQKKIEAYELLLANYSPIVKRLRTYSLLEEDYKETYNEFMRDIFKDLSNCEDISNKYSLYISTTKIGVHLSIVYSDIIHLFNDDKTLDSIKINRIIEMFSMITTQMKSDLLGPKFYEEAEKDQNDHAWKAIYERRTQTNQ